MTASAGSVSRTFALQLNAAVPALSINATSLAFGARVPGGGTCGRHPCWRQIRNTFSYTNTGGTPDGVKRMTLRATAGRVGALVAVSGGGGNLHLAVPADAGVLLRESPEVIVQLQRSDGPDCWEAVFTSPATRYTRGVFADTIH